MYLAAIPEQSLVLVETVNVVATSFYLFLLSIAV